MENNIPLHLTMFNNKVKIMNQTNEKSITLSANEARNLHADIFELLNQYHNIISKKVSPEVEEDLNIQMDGGKF